MNKLTKKIVSISLAVAMAVLMVGTPASAQTAAELQAQIASLLATIQALQTQLNASSGGSTVGTGSSYSFTRDLTLGSTGADVKVLQQWLNANGYTVAASGAGSAGNESTYFGNASRAAVAKYQAAKGLTPAVGYFGSKTRASLTVAGGTGGTVVVLPGTSYLSVMADGPMAVTIPDGSIYTPLLRLKFSAGNAEQRVTGVTVTRGGFVSNTNVTGLSVWDEAGNRYGNIITALTADGRGTVSFSGNPFVVPAGQTKTLIVAANLSESTNSGTIYMSVASASDITVAAGSSAAAGTFPLAGNVMTVVDGANSLGNVYVDDQSVAGGAWSSVTTDAGNLEIGDTNREIFKLRLVQNNSKEAIRLEKLVLFAEGTIREASDVTNWKLYSPEGNVIATASRPYDRYVTFILTTPYVVDKGLTKDFSVKADITDGAGYYFRASIQNDYDLVVRGVTTGAAVLPLDSAGASLTQTDTQGANSAFKMKSGALTISKAPTSPSGNVAPAANNVVLATYNLRSNGEQLEVRKLGVQVDYNGVDLNGTLVIRDAATSETYLSLSADTANLTESTGTPDASSLLTYQRDLSSYIVIGSGQTKTIEVVGSISANATSSSNYTVYLGQAYVKRYSTNDYTNLAAAAYQANQIAVNSVTMSITKSASFANTNRAAGSANVKVAEFVLQPSAADDIKVNSITFDIASSSFIQNVSLMMDGQQLGQTIGSPSATGNTFTTNVTIAKSATKVVGVYADIRSDATVNTAGEGTMIVSVNDAGVSGYGVLSGTSLTATPNGDLAGQTITVLAGTVTISREASAPISKIVLAGAQGVELNKIKFEASNENLTLTKLTLSLTTASTTVWAAATDIAANIGKVYLYDGATLLNAGGSSLASGEAVISGLSLTLVQGTPKVLTVKADINGSDTMTPKSVGGIKVKSSSTDDMEIYASAGRMSTGITLTSNAASNNFLFTAAAPVITNTYTGNTSKLGDSNDEVGRFTITNAGTREITLASTTVVVSMSVQDTASTSLVSNFRLFESSDLTNAVATTTATVSAATAATASSTFTFGALAAFSPTQTIAGGQSRTYIIKADTTSVEGSLDNAGTTDTYLTLKLVGAAGHSSSDSASSPSGEELYWNDGVVSYSYTAGSNNGTTYSSLNGSDSGEVSGPTLRY
ncbi:MAG: peptidoglycan-binding domain-containing protein [bacterium]|nr:peptidoglycan-binding domain-containing protein [bacterium]